MFTGVLLHMVAAARPINAAFHRLPNRQRCADSVGDHAAMLLHIRYKGGAQRTGIAGLAAALRVKGVRSSCTANCSPAGVQTSTVAVKV